MIVSEIIDRLRKGGSDGLVAFFDIQLVGVARNIVAIPRKLCDFVHKLAEYTGRDLTIIAHSTGIAKNVLVICTLVCALQVTKAWRG
jgi:hypothetical protein